MFINHQYNIFYITRIFTHPKNPSPGFSPPEFASPEQAITRVRSPEFSPPKCAPPQYYQPRERYPDLYISSCVEPVDILWFIPYVDSLTLGKYDGKLIRDDAVESESKKSKFDDEEKVWKEYEEVTIRLIKSLENVKMKNIACNIGQIKVLSHLLIADTWIVSNDDFTVERYNKRLIVEVSSPHKCLVDFLDLAYGTKCDDTEKLEILILDGYEDCHITDIHKLQEYLPLLQNIIIYWNYDGGNLATAIVEPLMATKFERPMKITIATDDSYSDDDYIIEMVNLILKWRELDPNVSIKLCITDKYGIEDQLSDEVLHEFKKIASTPDWPQEYSFLGDRLEVIVTEEID
uniref:FolB domain-containing protein n=1 Tax=Bursaphelenchus xylophilus TaxID=6326 RepID=A0A1I7S2C1_BURXY